MMMTANLVGFVVGIEGTAYMLRKLIGSWEGILSEIFRSDVLLHSKIFCRCALPNTCMFVSFRWRPGDV